MKKVYIEFPFDEKEKKQLESISDQYEFVYKDDKDANIVIGHYPAKRLKEFKNLEWVQTAAVGIDAYIRDNNLNDGVILTNAVGAHSKEVAEHIFAMIISMTRKLYLYRDNQRKHLWKDEGKVKEITNLKVTILGFGDIGNELAKMLKALGIYIIGVKRTITSKPDYIDELYTSEDMNKAISDVDVVVSVLPGNKANAYLFNVDTFKMMRPDTIFINAGRGNLYTTQTLKEVLDKKIIAAISADVFEKEPLSKDSELWDYENLVITPHAAGNYKLISAQKQFFDLVKENLERYINNKELLHVVKERE